MEDLSSLKRKVKQYKEVLNNTKEYRQNWTNELRQRITDTLTQMASESGLEAEIVLKENIKNLEAVVLDLGRSKSGISEKVSDEVHRPLIKHNGSLVYQQLFNGKIIVLITYPMIEGYGEPRPPKTIAIYRPEELKPPFFVRHMEDFMKEVTNWEDFDDDEPSQKIGFKLNFLEGTEGGGTAPQ
ncbi:MAG: hypothetical protein AAFV95_21750 [Bacteroidota bacterium]